MVVIIRVIFEVFSIIVIVKVILSYFLSPYNNIRQVFDHLVDPLLVPIRRLIPQIANLDFSPIILLLLLQLVQRILLSFF
jgi:YggT family protein